MLLAVIEYKDWSMFGRRDYKIYERLRKSVQAVDLKVFHADILRTETGGTLKNQKVEWLRSVLYKLLHADMDRT